MEPYPIVSRGRIVGFVSSSADITVYYDSQGSPARRIVWFSTAEGAIVDGLVDSRGVLEAPSGYRVELSVWFEELPRIGFYTTEGLEAEARRIAERLRGLLEGRRVLVAFSGGKDSFVALALLARAREYVDLRLYAVYSYMPVLEPRENLEYARRAAERLGVEFIETGPPERIVVRYLLTEGLPYRGVRWCTYLKTRPLREAAKKLDVHYMVRGDRIFEALKRMRRLYWAAVEEKIVEGKQLRPTFTWTILDVVRAARSLGYTHPDHLRGLPRVSCSYCPYKSLYEFTATRETGWEGLIEDVLRREYRVWYEGKGIPWSDFVERRLWRYRPQAARAWLEVGSMLEKLADRGEVETVQARRVLEDNASMWREELPGGPVYTVEKLLGELEAWLRRVQA